VVAVTVLTSLSEENLPPGMARPYVAERLAADLTRLALAAGAAGVVCSGAELAGLRRRVPEPFFAVTPGIRGPGEAAHDQRRTVGAAEAVRAGADLLVIGRPITRAADPREALLRARAEVAAAGWGRAAGGPG
jgi:orotidine-5'-phosphate decarboxylase